MAKTPTVADKAATENTEIATENALATTEDFGTDLVLSPEEEALLASLENTLSGSLTLSTTKIGYKDRGGAWKFPDDTEVEAFNGVVVAAKHANIHYPAQFVKGSPSGADCVAVRSGTTDTAFDALVPIPAVTSPYNQTCRGCPKLEWGSDPQGGRGKACAETLVMAVLIPQLGDELYIVEARRKWSQNASSYLSNVTSKFRAPLAVLTEFHIGSDNSPYEQTYRTVSRNPTELVKNLIGRVEEANDLLEAHVKNALRQNADSDALEGIVNDPTAGRETRKR